MLVLLFGLMLGTAIGRWSVLRYGPDFRPGVKKFDRKMDRFGRHLDLTPEQREKIHAIFEEKHRVLEEFHQKWRPKMEEMRKKTDAEIQAILNPEQIEKYKKLKAHREKRWGKRKNRGHRRHGPPEATDHDPHRGPPPF